MGGGGAGVPFIASSVRYRKTRMPTNRLAPIAVSVGVRKNAANGASSPAMRPVMLVTANRAKRETALAWHRRKSAKMQFVKLMDESRASS